MAERALKIYFAGDLFDHKDLAGNLLLADAIEKYSGNRYQINLPQDGECEVRCRTSQSIRDADFQLLFNSDVIIANFDGTDLDSGPSRERTAEYREGLYVGYRYFESAGVPVRYPFGHGLSYTEFAYSDIEVAPEGVSFTVTNTGARAGAEIAQLYVYCKNGSVYRPKKELKGFQKVFLSAGESKRVNIAFDDKTFRYFDTESNEWAVEDADYEICIARNASNVVLSDTLHVLGRKAAENAPTCYKNADIKAVSDADFEALLGHSIPDGKWSGEIAENDALCQLYYAKGAFARFLYRVLTSIKEKADAKGEPN